MEFLLLLIVGSIIYGFIVKHLETKDTNADINFLNKSSNVVDTDEVKQRKAKRENNTTINNYYTQNNIYVQQNNYSKKSKSKDTSTDHSEKVWNKLGYRIKRGESYSYKFYGNMIFTPDQVEKIGSYKVQYSETGLAKKLLKDTGSKSHAKDILVHNYGLSKSKAQNLLNIIEKDRISL